MRCCLAISPLTPEYVSLCCLCCLLVFYYSFFCHFDTLLETKITFLSKGDTNTKTVFHFAKQQMHAPCSSCGAIVPLENIQCKLLIAVSSLG